jgi:hypothetical protein
MLVLLLSMLLRRMLSFILLPDVPCAAACGCCYSPLPPAPTPLLLLLAPPPHHPAPHRAAGLLDLGCQLGDVLCGHAKVPKALAQVVGVNAIVVGQLCNGCASYLS